MKTRDEQHATEPDADPGPFTDWDESTGRRPIGYGIAREIAKHGKPTPISPERVAELLARADEREPTDYDHTGVDEAISAGRHGTPEEEHARDGSVVGVDYDRRW